jgi:hypothetical protein
MELIALTYFTFSVTLLWFARDRLLSWFLVPPALTSSAQSIDNLASRVVTRTFGFRPLCRGC